MGTNQASPQRKIKTTTCHGTPCSTRTSPSSMPRAVHHPYPRPTHALITPTRSTDAAARPNAQPHGNRLIYIHPIPRSKIIAGFGANEPINKVSNLSRATHPGRRSTIGGAHVLCCNGSSSCDRARHVCGGGVAGKAGGGRADAGGAPAQDRGVAQHPCRRRLGAARAVQPDPGCRAGNTHTKKLLRSIHSLISNSIKLAR